MTSSKSKGQEEEEGSTKLVSDDAIEKQMIKLHKEKSELLEGKGESESDSARTQATSTSVQKHLTRQRELFDDLSDFFIQKMQHPMKLNLYYRF